LRSILGLHIMSFADLEKLWHDGYLGQITSKYWGFFGKLILGGEKRTKKFFEYYSKQKVEIPKKDLKYFTLSEHDFDYLLPFFRSFGEVWNAFWEFDEILFYINNYPGSIKYKKKISLFEWGNYHLEATNHQFFILRERVLQFIRTMEKISKADKDPRFLKLKDTEKVILDYFEPFVAKRHELVHQKSFLDENLNGILAEGTILEKKLKKGVRTWNVRDIPKAEEKMKKKLDNRTLEISEELKKLFTFLDSNFKVVWEIMKDW